jgi:MFS family permease
MFIDGRLSLSQKKRSQRFYLMFTSMNGVSATCLVENILILFALEMGCPDYFVAALASIFYFGNLFMLVGKKMIGRFGAAKTITLCWAIRNSFALLSVFSPFFLKAIGPWAGYTALAIGTTGFFCFRSAGIVGMQPLIGEITSDKNRGKFTSLNFRFFNIATFSTMIVLALIMRYSKSLETFQVILGFGAFFGFLSTLAIYQVKEGEVPKQSALLPIKESIINAWNDSKIRKLLFANCATFSALMLVVPISMLALKEGYDISDQRALLFALLQLSGGITISVLCGILSEETGPRPLAILNFAGLLIIALLWLLAPYEFFWYYVLWIFLLAGICGMGVPIALGHYFLLVVKEKDRVGAGLFIALVTGACAGLSGLLVSAGLIKVLRYQGFSGLDLYKVYFGVVLVLLAIFLFFVSRLERLRDWEVGKVLGLAFTPRDIRTLLLLNGLEGVMGPRKEIEAINKLEVTGSGLSEKSILSSIDSPKLLLRNKAFQALRHIPFGDAAEKALLNELEYGEFSLAYLAAQILGERGVKAAVPLLKKRLESEDVYLQGKCMVALVQLHEKSSYARIEEIFAESSNPRIIIHGAVALAEIGDPEALSVLLKKSLDSSIPKKVRYEILTCIAEIGEIGDGYYKFLKLYRENTDDGYSFMVDFVENLNDTPMVKDIRALLMDYHYDKIDGKEVCHKLLELTIDKKRTIIAIIDRFLEDYNNGDIYPEFVYCILALFRKHGAI